MSLLRQKLAAMKTHPPAKAVSRVGLRVIRSESPVPPGLMGDIDPRAIQRMGFSAWPGREGLLFLDTETTGLAGGAGTIIFLTGLGYISDGRLFVEQYLLGDYSDEIEMLVRVTGLLSRHSTVVTFNGDAFDMPLLSSRATMNRLSSAMTSPASYDLIKPSRRLWKKRLGSVRLSVLEREVLRRERADDLPGSEAPRRFFEFLKTGDNSLLDPVIEHNRLDVVSMAHLLDELIAAYSSPAGQSHPVDLLSMAAAMEKAGDGEQAENCYRVLTRPRVVRTAADLRYKAAGAQGLFALGMIYKRRGDCDGALKCFESAVQRGFPGTRPMIELAKLLEHAKRDYDGAIKWTIAAMSLENGDGIAALERRYDRLIKKAGRPYENYFTSGGKKCRSNPN
ncbi:MAG: ribonuclease H-like domain-containing protein [Clostridia bacterium]|nr:ribonuclease H-like domain-containing protein [Clostridia bacterium]